MGEPGRANPEIVGRRKECDDAVLAHLRDREVHSFERGEEI